MVEQLPSFIVLLPMLGAMLVGIFGIFDHKACLPITIITLAATLASAIGAAWEVAQNGPMNYFMAGWEEPLGIGIQLRIDSINALLLVVIGIVALFVAFFSIRTVGSRDTEKTPQFYLLFLLLCCGLFGITMTNDAFNLFVLVEVSSLTSYALIAMGKSARGKLAAFHYLLMGTTGASFYLLGVGYLYLKTGSLNMTEIRTVIDGTPALSESPAITIAFIFILVGIWIKMAFFPLYGWLPNAYSYCPSASSCLLAPLVTKVSVYIMVRVMFTVFGGDWVFEHLGWDNLVVWLAVIAIAAGSTLALAQREIKKVFCYLIVAEVGYMVGGAWLADDDSWGLTGTLYHILGDAAMTLCLFLAAGIFAKRLGATLISDLDGVFRKMPLTSAAFIVGALAIIGVPPTCGFFSKFYLIRGGIDSGHWEFVIALLLSSLASAVMFFRIFEIAHFGNKPTEGHGHADDEHGEDGSPAAGPFAQEAPWTMVVPIWGAALLIIGLGLFNGQIVAFIRSGLSFS